MTTHSSILTWRIPMDRGAWWATVLGVAESDTHVHISGASWKPRGPVVGLLLASWSSSLGAEEETPAQGPGGAITEFSTSPRCFL